MRILPAALVLLVAVSPVLADGFHSPLLREKDPRRWAKTLRENLGLDRSDSAEGEAPAGAFERKAAAGNLVNVLKYLDRKNVLLREFPNFNYGNIPAFKSETEALLIALGAEAVPILVETLVTDLSGVPAGGAAGDLRPASDFVERVIRILVAIGEDSLPRVFAHLGDDERRVVVAMLRIVREIVVEPDFGTDVEDWRRWYRIHFAGRRRDPEAVPELVKALEDGDTRFRAAAAEALGEIRSRQAVPGLLGLLRDRSDTATIRVALRALAKIGDETAAAEMISLLDHPRPEVREEAVTALRFLTRKSFSYDPRGPAEEREGAIGRWREWWKTR